MIANEEDVFDGRLKLIGMDARLGKMRALRTGREDRPITRTATMYREGADDSPRLLTTVQTRAYSLF